MAGKEIRRTGAALVSSRPDSVMTYEGDDVVKEGGLGLSVCSLTSS